MNTTTIYQICEADLEAVLGRMFGRMMDEARHIASTEAKDALLTPDQAADTLQISKVTLWRWEKQGYLVPVSIGGKKRYKSRDIQRIIEKGGQA